MRWAEHVPRVEERRIQGLGGENLRGRDQLEDPGVEGRILIRIFRKWHVGARTGSSSLRWRALVNTVMNLRVS
jgi:hypothetical protein